MPASRALTTVLLQCVMVAVLLAFGFEYGEYAQRLPFVHLGVLGHALVYGILVGHSLLVLGPVILVVWLLLRLGWHTAAHILLFAAQAAAGLWIILDVRLETLIGRPLLSLIAYAQQRGWGPWAGGTLSIARDAAKVLVVVLVIAGASYGACKALVGVLNRHWPWLQDRRAVRLCGIGYVLYVAGLLAFQLLRVPEPFRTLAATMPITRARFTRDVDTDSESEFSHAFTERLKPVLAATHPHLRQVQAADEQARVNRPGLPNVIVLILESFRADALSPSIMPRLTALSARGLTLRRHYAGSNGTHLGLYDLLYGRLPLEYPRTIGQVPPQLPLSMRLSGYTTSYVSGMDNRDWFQMGRFINDQVFDNMVLLAPPEDGCSKWPDWDRQVMAAIHTIIATHEHSPQFIVAFLASTHFPYMYPAARGRHLPVVDVGNCTTDSRDHGWALSVLGMSPLSDREALWNRYRNAAGFLDDEIADLIASLDAERNLVVITGDHGESLWDDGTLAHSSRASEIQMRVPCIFLWPQLAGQSIDRATMHADILPTILHVLAGQSIPVRGNHGRDLLASPTDGDHVILMPLEPGDTNGMPKLRFVLVTDDRRLRVRISETQPAIEGVETISDAGARVPGLPEPHAATQWADWFAADLARLVDGE